MPEIRRFHEDDFAAVFDLLAARSRAAFGVSEQQPGFLRQALALPGTESWVAIVEGRIAGHATLGETRDATLAATDPRVGDALLATVEDAARDRGFTELNIAAVPEDEPLHALVQRGRFLLEREILRMWRKLDRDLPEPRFADGVAVRTYTSEDGKRVHALLDREYGAWDPAYVARTHEGWLKQMTEHDEFDPEMWFLVERNGELVACALHWRELQGRGWVKDIVVAEAERGRGLGAALLHHAFRAYAKRGAERVGLKVDSTNPTGALRLYERTGFVVDRSYGIWTKAL